MPYAKSREGVCLYYEEAGSGTPILFVHEFAADYRSWEPQMRFFARRHRCITFSARGYKPSDVPPSADVYAYPYFMRDAVAILDHLGIAKAHVVGLSMGGYTTLQIGLNHPDRALSLTLAGTGSGADNADEFHRGSIEIAKQFETQGSAAVAASYGMGPSRLPFALKDPRGFAEFAVMLGEHDALGSANTMRGFQGTRPSIYDFADAIRQLAVPTLIVVGDEDDACLEPSLFLKRAIRPSGLVVMPKTGHTVNLEEPDLFNQALADFLARVEAGRWSPRGA